MKVYITKYALTQGIIEAEVTEEDVSEYKSGSMISIKNGPLSYCCFHGEGREWHKTRESAIKRCEEMRQRKINSLRRKIEKISNLNFE